MHEGNLARTMGVHDQEVVRHQVLMKKADQWLARKKTELEKEAEEKLKGCREQASHEYASKFKKQ